MNMTPAVVITCPAGEQPGARSRGTAHRQPPLVLLLRHVQCVAEPARPPLRGNDHRLRSSLAGAGASGSSLCFPALGIARRFVTIAGTSNRTGFFFRGGGL